MAKRSDYSTPDTTLIDRVMERVFPQATALTCDVCGKTAERLVPHEGHRVCSLDCAQRHDALCYCMPRDMHHERLVQYRRSLGGPRLY